MGLLDIPSIVFAATDDTLFSFLSPLLRLLAWGLIGSVISMFLYKWMSNQERIEAIKVDVASVRKELSAYSGGPEGLRSLIILSLTLSFKQIGFTLGPAVFSSLPALCLIIYISNAYGFDIPQPGDWVVIKASPVGVELVVDANHSKMDVEGIEVRWPKAGESIVIKDKNAVDLFSFPIESAIPVVHKKVWWNVFIGNPIGYLPESSEPEYVEINLKSRKYLSFGPPWLGSWEFVFFSFIVFASIVTKIVFRIH